MDLFHVDRYLGDDEEQEKSDVDVDVKLFSLQEHIANRKRELSALKINSGDDSNDVKSKKKKDSFVKDGKDELQEEKNPKGKEKREKKERRSKEKGVKRKLKSKDNIDGLDEQSGSDTDSDSNRNNKMDSSKETDDKMMEGNVKDQNTVHEGTQNILDRPSESSNHETLHADKPQDLDNTTGFTIIGGKRKKKEIKKVQRMLSDWLANPVIINADFGANLVPVNKLTCLAPFIQRKLQEQNIKCLFPVQSAIIPTILSQIQADSLCGLGGYQPPDLCISAPTGSGKTLAYVLPIVQALAKQVVCHLQALVLLPTKDLANQVKQVFEVFTQGTSLNVGVASGNKALAKEQESLVGKSYGSTSHVNILVSTPGRLVDHISSTPHFTLEHVRFLVIDEADRLLDQSYYNWLSRVLEASFKEGRFNLESQHLSADRKSLISCNLETRRHPPGPPTPASFSRIQVPLQKLLFSATMTHSPDKLAPLQLYEPMLFIASKPPQFPTGDENSRKVAPEVPSFTRYTIPPGLTEHMAVCSSGEKPLFVLYLLLQMNFTGLLCFTSSLEATHRLYLLLKLYGGVEVAEYSSSLSAQRRRGILRDFKLGTIQILICSDAMARGMDIENVSCVISYDAPNYVKTYIHRVGRTARAGKEGTAITLLHSEEVHHFKEVITKTGREKIPKYRIKDDQLQPMVEHYQETLQRLEETVKQEKQSQAYGHRSRGREAVEKLLQRNLMDNLGFK